MKNGFPHKLDGTRTSHRGFNFIIKPNLQMSIELIWRILILQYVPGTIGVGVYTRHPSGLIDWGIFIKINS
jgi:hypothetical protein